MADAVAGAAQHVNGSAVSGAPVPADSYAAKFNLAPHFIGGKGIELAPPSVVKDFVLTNGGHTTITNVRSKSRRRLRFGGISPGSGRRS